MKRSCAGRASIGCELALGIDATLEATERELGQVRNILRGAVEGLMVEFGQRAFREGVVALQFQDLSDQLLANAQRRIDMVRCALGKDVAPPAKPRNVPGPFAAGAIEFF
jgi:hypothetical protein